MKERTESCFSRREGYKNKMKKNQSSSQEKREKKNTKLPKGGGPTGKVGRFLNRLIPDKIYPGTKKTKKKKNKKKKQSKATKKKTKKKNKKERSDLEFSGVFVVFVALCVPGGRAEPLPALFGALIINLLPCPMIDFGGLV